MPTAAAKTGQRGSTARSCLSLHQRCQVKLCGSLGSWLTVVMSVKGCVCVWMGTGHPAGQTQPARLGPTRAATILPTSCPSCPSHAELVPMAYSNLASMQVSWPFPACRAIPPPLGSNMSDSCTHSFPPDRYRRSSSRRQRSPGDRLKAERGGQGMRECGMSE